MIENFHKIIKFFLNSYKKLKLFSKNKINVLKQNSIFTYNHKKGSLLKKNKIKNLDDSLPFEKRSPQSFFLQRKLALLVSDIDAINKKDFKYLQYRRYEDSKEEGLITSYRIDFYNKDDLVKFKKKYREYLL